MAEANTNTTAKVHVLARPWPQLVAGTAEKMRPQLIGPGLEEVVRDLGILVHRPPRHGAYSAGHLGFAPRTPQKSRLFSWVERISTSWRAPHILMIDHGGYTAVCQRENKRLKLTWTWYVAREARTPKIQAMASSLVIGPSRQR